MKICKKAIKHFDDYQRLSMRTQKEMKDSETQLEYAILSLCGESGELANLYKKRKYHNNDTITKLAYIEEISDALWYLACIADAMGIRLSEIAGFNIEKLEKRFPSKTYDDNAYNIRERK